MHKSSPVFRGMRWDLWIYGGSHLTDEAESGSCGAVGEFCADQNITSEKINTDLYGVWIGKLMRLYESK